MTSNEILLQNLVSRVTALMDQSQTELAQNTRGNAESARAKVSEAYKTLIAAPEISKSDAQWIGAAGIYKSRLKGMDFRFAEFGILFNKNTYNPS